MLYAVNYVFYYKTPCRSAVTPHAQGSQPPKRTPYPRFQGRRLLGFLNTVYIVIEYSTYCDAYIIYSIILQYVFLVYNQSSLLRWSSASKSGRWLFGAVLASGGQNGVVILLLLPVIDLPGSAQFLHWALGCSGCYKKQTEQRC